MDSSPLISVIIPMYNTGDYIEQTLKSVLTQTYKKLEVVIVDDGSSDNGPKIVEELKKNDSRIKYIYQTNQGVSAARNNGIANSTGEYLAFLDSDDLWKRDKLEKQMNRIMSTNMEASYCGYQMFCGEDMGKVFPERYFEGSILPEVVKEKVSVWTSTVIIKKSIVTDNNIFFRPGLNWSEDMEFFCKLLYICDFCCVKETLALYRQRPNSLSVSPNRIPEISLWMEFLDWLKVAPAARAFNRQKIIKAVTGYKLPSIAIFCLYQRLLNGEPLEEDFFIKVPLHMVYDFRPSLSTTGFKLWVKKMLIRYRYGYKKKAGIIRLPVER